MILKNIEEVTFEFVLERYFKENGIKNDMWELRNLERADAKFGSWASAKIPISEIENIVMPYHKYGGAEITPKEGALLSDAYENFTRNRKKLERTNSQFCRRIETQKRLISETGRGKIIYLSQEPLFFGLSYSGLTNFRGKITHLDGFHRLMALMDIKQRPDSIESFIAVYNSFFNNFKEN